MWGYVSCGHQLKHENRTLRTFFRVRCNPLGCEILGASERSCVRGWVTAAAYNSEEAFQYFNNLIQLYLRVPAVYWPWREHRTGEYATWIRCQEIFKPRPEDEVRKKD